MNRQVAYADSIRVAANAVVSDVNIVITSGDITARQRPQSDVVAAGDNIDARTSAQCYIELALDIDTR
jgi:predicted nicotinamide N-methyase